MLKIQSRLARHLAALVAAVTLFGVAVSRPSAQTKPTLAGRWMLNRELSQLPREVGFGADLVGGSESSPGGARSGGGGRGSRGGGSRGGGASGAPTIRRESEDDARRLQQLTAE